MTKRPSKPPIGLSTWGRAPGNTADTSLPKARSKPSWPRPDSLTGAYLSRRKVVPIPEKRRTGNGKHLTVVGARANNLKNLTVEIPLGKLVCITGVSGSGKSTLMVDILYNSLARQLHRAHTTCRRSRPH